MKEPRNYVILFLCLGGLGEGALLWQQRTELNDVAFRAGIAEKNFTQANTERAVLEKHVRDLEERTPTAQGDLAAARNRPGRLAAEPGQDRKSIDRTSRRKQQ